MECAGGGEEAVTRLQFTSRSYRAFDYEKESIVKIQV